MLAVRKKGVVTESLLRIFGVKLMEPGSCVGEWGLSKMVEFIIEGAPRGEVGIRSPGRRKVILAKRDRYFFL